MCCEKSSHGDDLVLSGSLTSIVARGRWICLSSAKRDSLTIEIPTRIGDLPYMWLTVSMAVATTERYDTVRIVL